MEQTTPVEQLEVMLTSEEMVAKPVVEEQDFVANEALQGKIKELLAFHEKDGEFYDVIDELKSLLPKKKPVKPYTVDNFKSEFFGYPEEKRCHTARENLSPVSIALLVLRDLFKDTERFTMFDPLTFPGFDKLDVIQKITLQSSMGEPTYTSIHVIGEQKEEAPVSGSFWLHDKKHDCKMIVFYAIKMGLSITAQGSVKDGDKVFKFVSEVEEMIMSSRYLRGQILEMNGSSFSIIDLKDQVLPAVEEDLKDELHKNVLNIFAKAEEFKAYNLPAKRAIILEGPPGCGKTMIARYLAQHLRGKTTVLWTSAKSIGDTDDIATLFSLARKLSPALLIMEDLDLIAGTRSDDQEFLGELLTQLDGLLPNDNLVVVASTNEVKSLDKALNDRPGRFDRIYQITKPSPMLAEKIARHYLMERAVDPEVIQQLNYDLFCRSGDLTGAQIVEVCKGGIYEAIHRRTALSDLCIAASYGGLKKQRKMITGETD